MTTKNISSTEIVDLTDEKNQDTNSERTIYTINNQTIEEFSKVVNGHNHHFYHFSIKKIVSLFRFDYYCFVEWIGFNC